MLSFSKIFETLEQSIKTLNASGAYACEIRLEADKEYILDMKSRYNNIKQRYERNMKLKAEQDYYATAYFFWTFLDCKKVAKPPIALFEKNGVRRIETSFSIVEGLEEIVQEITVSLLTEVTINILKPKSNNVTDRIDEIIKNLSTTYNGKESLDEGAIFLLAAIFRNL